MAAFSIAMGILLCFYLMTALFQTVRQSSVMGAMSLMSFLGVLVIILQTIVQEGISPCLSNDTMENVVGRQTLLYLDNHRLSSIQIIVAVSDLESRYM